ncbi:MAG: hypothetical protein WB992_02860 [Bryobacteraceae bacterium]
MRTVSWILLTAVAPYLAWPQHSLPGVTNPASTDQPLARATASEVVLDLVVRDKRNRMVRNLRPEEVRV